jgi:pimeloyl-ACP methyl ester carboxylesterase
VTSEIRFTTSTDGTRISYTTFGSGPPLVEVPRWAVTIEWNSNDDEFAAFYEKLARFRQVTIVERRGTGSSQREITDCSMHAHVADVMAVVDAAGLDSFDMMGSGDSVAVCIRIAAEKPERVRKLILWGGYARGFRLINPSNTEADEHYAAGFRTNFPATARLIADSFFPNQTAAQARRIANYWVKWVPPENAVKYRLWGNA